MGSVWTGIIFQDIAKKKAKYYLSEIRIINQITQKLE